MLRLHVLPGFKFRSEFWSDCGSPKSTLQQLPAWVEKPSSPWENWLSSHVQFKAEVHYSWEGLGKLLLMISWLLSLSWYQDPGMKGRKKEIIFSPLWPVPGAQLQVMVTPRPRNTGKEDEDFYFLRLLHLWALFQQHSWYQKPRVQGGTTTRCGSELGSWDLCLTAQERSVNSLIT